MASDQTTQRQIWGGIHEAPFDNLTPIFRIMA